MKIEELERNLKAGQLASVYLLYGEETYLLESQLKKIKNLFGEKIVGINYITIDETNLQDLIYNLSMPAFGYEKKLIIVKDCDLFKKETKKKMAKTQGNSQKIAEYLLENTQEVMDANILVFLAQEAEKNELYQAIEQIGVVCHFEKLKMPELVKRLKAICKAYGVTVEDDTLSYLIQNCGTSMQELINEVRKLIEYTKTGGSFGREEVDLLTIKQTEAVIFDVTDYLGNKNTKAAIDTLHELVANKEPLQRLLILIYQHFKKLYYTKLAEKSGKNLAESLSLKPNQLFLTSKYKKQASYFEETTLRAILQQLSDLDFNYKLGVIDLQIGLDAILCNYC